jgi:regulator of sigma E protease
MGYLETFVLLSILILIHELGHLAAARLVGIPVAGFSVGFGPKLWSRWWRGTEYAFRALPLGGYVAPAIADESELRAFALRKRLAFFLGGPLANIAAALPLFALLNATRGGFSFYAVVIAPFVQVGQAIVMFLQFLPTLFTNHESLSGVVGIVVQGNQLAQTGQLLELAISLTISLAVLNLLPIPVLDGGQIVMGCLEEAFPRLVRLRMAATLAGVVFLIGVMVLANARDVIRLLG